MSTFFNKPSDLVAGTTARANDINDRVDSTETGFDNVEQVIDRSIKLPVGTTDDQVLTESASNRANKTVGFDSSGDLILYSPYNWKADWASTTTYALHDTVRDSTTKNLYFCVENHTSGTFSTDLSASKWSLAINVADVETAKTAAQTAQTAAELAETNAETAETNAETAETNAETAETNAETAQTAAETAKGLAEDWAVKTSATVDGTNYSAKYWATSADVVAVAGKATQIGLLGTTDAIADMNTLGTADVVSDLNLLGTADVVSDLNILGTADVVSDMNILATADVVADMNTLGTADVVADMNTLGTADVVSDMNILAAADVVADMNTLGTADVVSDLNTLGTADVVSDLNTLGTADVVADMNTLATSANVINMSTVAGISADVTAVSGKATQVGLLGTSDAIADMNTLGTSDAVADMNTLGTADVVSDMNTLGTSGNVTNMNTVAGSIADVNRYAEEYTISSTAPSSPSEGDLWYDSTTNVLKYYSGSSWTQISTYTHPNHSGDVVSAADGAMTIQTDAVDIAMLSATGTAGATNFLRGDNTWETPTDTTYSEFSGTAAGLVPTSTTTDDTKFLRADGAWVIPTDTNTTYSVQDGELSQISFTTADNTKLDGIATSANNYTHPSGDGNLHVPATLTTNDGKVLTAGATAGALTWETPASGGGGGEANVQSNWTQSTTTDDAYILNKPTIQYTSAIPDSTTSQTGLATSTQITKLDGIATSANNYSHPTGDGNLHVPATSTTNNAKVLTAGSTAGSLSWETPSSGGGGASSIDDLTDAVGYTFVDGATTYESYGLGDGALSSVANGYSLVAVGDQSLASVESGHSNTAVGANALENLTFSSGNNALGSNALNGCSTGSRNNAFGYMTLWRNSTGSANHAVGSECMKNNYTGSNNCGFGRESLQASTGDENTAYGNFSLQSTTGTKNIGIGYTAGDAIGTGSNNTIIGDLPGSSTLADTVLIGAGTTERLKVNSTGLYVNGSTEALGGGGSAFTSSTTAPSSPTDGDHWFESSSGVLYVRLDSAWLDISTSGSGSSSSSGDGWGLISTSNIASAITSFTLSGDYSAYSQLKIVMTNMVISGATTRLKMSDDSGSTFCTWDQSSASNYNDSGFDGSSVVFNQAYTYVLPSVFGRTNATMKSMLEMDIYLDGNDIFYSGRADGNDSGGDHCFCMFSGRGGDITSVNYINFSSLSWSGGQVRLYGLTT